MIHVSGPETGHFFMARPGPRRASIFIGLPGPIEFNTGPARACPTNLQARPARLDQSITTIYIFIRVRQKQKSIDYHVLNRYKYHSKYSITFIIYPQWSFIELVIEEKNEYTRKLSFSYRENILRFSLSALWTDWTTNAFWAVSGFNDWSSFIN